MRHNYSSFWVPKRGNTADEYEDAFSIDIERPESKILKLAIADGSSEGFFSKIWADILVKNFQRNTFPNVQAFLEHCSEDWRIWKSNYLRERKLRERPIQWFEEDGIRKGAFSTLLGLHIYLDDSYWEATVVGDSCLFQIRNGSLLHSFPVRLSESFDNRPVLLSSENPLSEEIQNAILSSKGSIDEGDCLLLMTDALSAWFLKEIEDDNDPLKPILALDAQDEFACFVEILRDEKGLHNDDVTLVKIRGQ